VSLKNENYETVENNIGEGKSLDDKVNLMVKALQSLNLRFQVATHELESNPSYVDDLLDSDIIETDLAQVHNVNASFDMPFLDPVTGA
jgi:hypothetical protein